MHLSRKGSNKQFPVIFWTLLWIESILDSFKTLWITLYRAKYFINAARSHKTNFMIPPCWMYTLDAIRYTLDIPWRPLGSSGGTLGAPRGPLGAQRGPLGAIVGVQYCIACKLVSIVHPCREHLRDSVVPHGDPWVKLGDPWLHVWDAQVQFG